MKTARKTIPLIPLRGMTVFPNMIVHFDIGRDKSLKAIETAMLKDEKILLVTQKDTNIDEPKLDELYEVGTIVSIKQIVKLKPPLLKILVEGEKRAKVIALTEDEYIHAEIEEIEESIEDNLETEALMRTVGDLFENYAKLNTKLSGEMVYNILGASSPIEVIDLIIANMPLEIAIKQKILECMAMTDRIYEVIGILQKEVEVLELQRDIFKKVKDSIDKTQKEYFLREQLKIIQDELGEKDGVKAEAESYRQQIETRNLSEEVKDKLEKEIIRYLKVPTSSPESGVIRGYIENILELPWDIRTEENIDIIKAKQVLEEDHYGLVQIKERILEYLAVRKLANRVEAPILCLVGPPGVGKTSIVESIAKATNRNYVRISLGGVRDEAEIRGHRRTYVGAMPGRFIQSLKVAKSNNPLMLLDEIDKMMGDFRGDPAAALLEILDSQQNKAFRDHYLELPFDLSHVMFIATANTLSTIPRPLLDRMDIIDVSSYTAVEKLEIANTYLWPKQLGNHGLAKKQCKLNKETLAYVIDHYTRESGVRNLNRQLGNICRKVSKELIEKDKKSITVNLVKVKEYLGAPRYTYEEKNKAPQVGVVRGLAWTAVGGDTLSIEVNIMPGRGTLDLTGNMGNVMKESAKAAISYIRSRGSELGLEKDFYKDVDIHIHIPEGAVPKDGPSAGITMATAIISAFTGKPIRNDIAMTGEITIRGRVLPIGGLKEKILAAKRAGIFDVIVPKANEKDIKELEANIIDKMNINYADKMEDVLQYVFATLGGQ
ncbi:MAG: endopeptidase La [Cellulosilyticaceae bacterium]